MLLAGGARVVLRAVREDGFLWRAERVCKLRLLVM
jgi:hypothetical protein